MSRGVGASRDRGFNVSARDIQDEMIQGAQGAGAAPAAPASFPEPDGTLEELRAALASARERIAQLEELAHVDELTGVLNRRGFQRELARARSYVERYGVPVMLVLADLDHFKQINDSHGHLAGDAVLRGVARLLQGNVRASDVVARVGGDEFALLLWHADLASAAQALIKMQQRLGAARIDHAGQSFVIEASLGLAPVSANQSADEIYAEADRSLYAAKTYRRSHPPRRGPDTGASAP